MHQKEFCLLSGIMTAVTLNASMNNFFFYLKRCFWGVLKPCLANVFMYVLHITKCKFYHLCMDRVVVEKNICSYCWCVLFSRSACCPTPSCQMWLATRCGCWNARMRPAAVTPPCSSPSPFPSVPSWSCSTSRTGFDALSIWYDKPRDILNITFKSKLNKCKCIP